MVRSSILRYSRKGAVLLLFLGIVTMAHAAEGEAVPCTEETLSVPALSTWAAVVMTILMLTTSSFAMYGGNIVKRKQAAGTASVAKPGSRNPMKVRETGVVSRHEPSAKRREAQLRRERRRMNRTHRATSRSKKRRVGPGCRGPLRKT